MNRDGLAIQKTLLFFPVLLLSISSLVFCIVTGSAHDFSDDTWNSGGEICLPCHTPHHAKDITLTIAPLWNHESTGTVFSLYTGFDMQVTPGQPTGITLLCLSCHDGTIGLDAFGSTTSGTVFMTGTGLIGTDLGDDHPVSIEWLHQTYDAGSSGWCTNCHNVHSTPTYISELVFFDGNIECATCHDVHNTAGVDKLLRITNAGSELCLTCHDK